MVADAREWECRWLTRDPGERARFVTLDVTDEGRWDAALREAEQEFGPLSVLVNNAAIPDFGTIRRCGPARWRSTIEVNLVGAYLGIRAVAPSMRRAGGGSIVNISSTAGFTAAPRSERGAIFSPAVEDRRNRHDFGCRTTAGSVLIPMGERASRGQP